MVKKKRYDSLALTSNRSHRRLSIDRLTLSSVRYIFFFSPPIFSLYRTCNVALNCPAQKKRPSGRMECQLSWVYRRMSSDLVVRDGRLYRRSPRRITLWKERVCPECYRF